MTHSLWSLNAPVKRLSNPIFTWLTSWSLTNLPRLRRSALVIKQSSPPEKVIAYGIASVFCPPENRNKGYASHMMRLLHHILAPAESLPPFPKEWGTPPPSYPGVGKDARLSMLYSYVGDFYRSCGPSPDTSGWHILGAVGTTWKLKPKDLIYNDVSDESYYFLSKEQCVNLWESDAAYITECMSQLPASPRTRFTCLPNNGVASYFIHRTLAEAPLHPKHTLEHWGVAVRSEGHEKSPSAYATWTLDMYLSKPPSILVTRLRASPDSLPTLLKGLFRVAGQIGADSIEVWNLDTNLVNVAESMGGHTAARDDNFPAVVWYGPEKPNEIEWVFNEKYVSFHLGFSEILIHQCSLLNQVCMVLSHTRLVIWVVIKYQGFTGTLDQLLLRSRAWLHSAMMFFIRSRTP